jgi:hypothetical protein
LEIVTPKEIDLKVISTTHQNIVQGQEIWVSGKIFEKIGRRMKWHSLCSLGTAPTLFTRGSSGLEITAPIVEQSMFLTLKG